MLFRCYEQQIEALFGGGADVVVRHLDRGCKLGVFLKQSAAVDAVEDIVRDLEHPARESVLKIEDIESCDALNALAILLVVLHNLLVTHNASGSNLAKADAQQILELLGAILADMPRIARERHRGVGCRDDKLATRAQHASNFPHKLDIILNMLDNLKADNIVKTATLKANWRHGHLVSLDILNLGNCGLNKLVYSDKLAALWCKNIDSIARTGANLEYIAANNLCRIVVRKHRALIDIVIRRLA